MNRIFTLMTLLLSTVPLIAQEYTCNTDYSPVVEELYIVPGDFL